MSRRGTLSRDFWVFFSGQTVSQLGTSFSEFAIPLLVFKLTKSSVNLGIAFASVFLPYLLFGLVIGAWTDRLDRKRLMIVADLLRAGVVGTIPLLYLLHALSVWWIYGVGFGTSVLSIFFTGGEFAAIPSLVGNEDLVTANGRIQASYSAAQVLGPLLAGALVSVFPIAAVFLADAVSFVVSAGTLAGVRTSFNAPREGRELSTIRRDVAEGLRYVLRHPVLRNLSAMLSMLNFIMMTAFAQLVFFSKVRLHATDAQVGVIFAAGSVGVIATGLLAGRIRRRLRFGVIIPGTLMLEGLLILAFSSLRVFWLGVLVWAGVCGFDSLYDINAASLRQTIVPKELLGRVVSIAGVLAWSAIPLGTVLGGWVIHATGNVALVYGGIGALEFLIALAFSFSPIGRADNYLPPAEASLGEVR